jgi:nitroreductase
MVEELFQQRRTIRYFTEKRIPREILQGIVQIGVYAPTNHYHLRAIVIDSPEIIERFDTIIMRYIRLYYNLFYRSAFVFNLLRRVSPAVNSKQKVKLSRGMEHGKAFETPPAAMIFIVGDRRYIKAEASAQYALYNMILYGHTQGIGSRIQSAGPMTLDLDRKARKLLGLGRKEHILGTLDFGYPAVRFRNKVAGRSLPMQWNQEVVHA